MTTAARLAVYGIGLAAVFGAGATLGAAVGPLDDRSDHRPDAEQPQPVGGHDPAGGSPQGR